MDHPGRTALTDRDTQILRGLALGRSRKEIAFDLGLSPKTVEYHINAPDNPCSIITKIGKPKGATNQELVRFAVENGLVKRGEKPSEIKKPLKCAVKVLRTSNELAQALLEGASQAAAGQADVLQLNALCNCSDALCRLAALQMRAEERCSKLPWLDGEKT